jgi:CMP-2-keto-3-deoxyoctulosonic acid synthetase
VVVIKEINGEAVITDAEFKSVTDRARTRMGEKAIAAAYRVVVQGERPSDVAHALGVQRQLVHRAAAKVRSLHLEANAYPPDWIEARVVAPADMLERFREQVERARRKAMKLLTSL